MKDVNEMDADVAQMAYEAITQIEARDRLTEMKIAQLPYMKPEDARKAHRGMHELAFPEVHDATKPVVITIDKMAAILNGKR